MTDKLKQIQAMSDALALVESLHRVVSSLYKLYDTNPDLNELQPDSFSRVIPMSLDEWALAIDKNVVDWKKGLYKLIVE